MRSDAIAEINALEAEGACPQVIENAILFLYKTPTTITPSVALEPDGDIVLDWFFPAPYNFVLSISVGQKEGSCNFPMAWLGSGGQGHGVLRMIGTVNKQV